MKKEMPPRDSIQKTRHIYKDVPVGLCYFDTDLRYVQINDWLAGINGIPAEEHLGRTIAELIPEIATEVESQLRRVVNTGEPIVGGEVEAETPARPGIKRHFQHSYYPVMSKDGEVIGISCFVEEVTARTEALAALQRANDELDRRVRERTAELRNVNESLIQEIAQRARAEEALGDRERHTRGVMTNIADAVVTIDARGKIQSFNPAAEGMFEYAAVEVIGKNVSVLMPEPDRGQHDGYVHAYLETGKGKILGIGSREVTARRKDGGTFPMELTVGEMKLGDEPVFIGAMRDISERKQVQAALEESEARLSAIVNNAPLIIVLKDPEGRFVKVNKLWTEIFGFTESEVVGKTVHEVLPKEIAASIWKVEREAISTERAITVEYDELLNIDDRHFVEVVFPLFDVRGSVSGICAIATDDTARVQQEEQLRQSQKMDAVGQLTGGVAHDFNNLLTVTLGNLELLQEHVANDPAAQELIDTAIKASERGADLTQRLLAFSRKQALDPAVTEVNRLISDSIELLRRTLGADIEIEAVLDDDLWKAMVDSKQLENAILNLALNARDAMPGGGRLTIETANIHLDREYADTHDEVRSGRYVLIEVSDTGAGMTAEVMHRAFDPFFTTKEIGQGSGLGLSMVYGFAKQSDGHVAIYSQAGHGTTVKLYLPRAMSAERTIRDEPGRQSPPPKGSETLLVVEDDAAVRAFITTALRSVGYRVIEAEDGESALVLVDETPDIGLLITDVILPHGMNGRDVADGLTKRRPGTKVLFTSGYAESIVVHQGKLDEGVELLRKPYTRDTLARRVRQILDAPNAGPLSGG